MRYGLCIVLLLASIGLSAQFAKGDQIVGPNISIGYSKSSSEVMTQNSSFRNTTLGLGGDYLLMQSDKKGIGGRIRMSILSQKQTFNANADITSNGLGETIEVFYRNFYKIAAKFYFNIEYGLGISNTNIKTRPNDVVNNNFGVNAYLMPGINYFAKENLIIVADFNPLGSLGYSVTKSTTSQGTSKQNTFSLSTHFFSNDLLSNILFGVKWIIPHKKELSNKQTAED